MSKLGNASQNERKTTNCQRTCKQSRKICPPGESERERKSFPTVSNCSHHKSFPISARYSQREFCAAQSSSSEHSPVLSIVRPQQSKAGQMELIKPIEEPERWRYKLAPLCECFRQPKSSVNKFGTYILHKQPAARHVLRCQSAFGTYNKKRFLFSFLPRGRERAVSG